MTTGARLVEALTVPCASCGAPLPLNPALASAWCPTCRRWSAVPDAVRAQALEQARAVSRVEAARAEQQRLAAAEERTASTDRSSSEIMELIIAGSVLFGVLTTGVSVAAVVVPLLSDVDETWLIDLGIAVGGLVVLVMLAAAAGAVWVLVRRSRRRRLRIRAAARWGGGQALGSAAAICGECGAPIAFRVGESTVTCGFCHSVVVAAPAQERRLIALAFGEQQRAQLIHAQAERDRLRAEMKMKRDQTILFVYVAAGSLAVLALPAVFALYAWRALTPSIHHAMSRLARALSGQFGSGLDPAFSWLDAYWIGSTPAPLRSTQPFQSRWTVETVFHDRPVMITTTTSVTDRVATHFAILLARPRKRGGQSLQSSSAARIRSLGLEPLAEYAGVGAQGENSRLATSTPPGSARSPKRSTSWRSFVDARVRDSPGPAHNAPPSATPTYGRDTLSIGVHGSEHSSGVVSRILHSPK